MANNGNARGNGIAIRQHGPARRKLSWLAALTGTTALVALPGTASADCQPAGGGDYTCDGTETVGQVIFGDNVNVLVSPGFSVDTTGGAAMRIAGNGDLRFLGAGTTSLKGSSIGFWIQAFGNAGPTPGGFYVDLAGSVTGGITGFSSSNAGSGRHNVQLTGHVEGTTQYGVEMVNFSGADFLQLYTTSVTGGTTGVEIRNNGNSSTVARLTGHIIGSSDTGVNVLAGANTTDLDIFATSVTGGQFGINAEHQGTGATRIIASGHVVGGSDTGIRVMADETTTNLTVLATTVTGGQHGIFTQSYGSGTTSITTYGHVEGTNNTGIYAYTWAFSSDLIVDVTSVTGGQLGIDLENLGRGATSVTATGHVQGTGDTGIAVTNISTNTSDLTVQAASVTGGIYGIDVRNGGDGATRVTASGHVEGGSDTGIRAVNVSLLNEADSLTIEAASVTGRNDGISAVNAGLGTTSITATGHVQGTMNTGIRAFNNNLTATDLIVQAASVTGGIYGIDVWNRGDGATRVTASGHVEGGSDTGIRAVNDSPLNEADSLTIEAASVTGGLYGIDVENRGAGATSITATGHVQGTGEGGIRAYNGLSATDLIVDVASVTGVTGISTTNFGFGRTHISASGHIAGTGSTGMTIVNGTLASDMVIEAASVSGETVGVYALNGGRGATRISATGLVEGVGHSGIYAHGFAPGTDVIIEATSATGGLYGLYVENEGSGVTRLTSSGLVAGGTAAISAVSTAGNAVEVHNLAGGMLRNQSGASSDAAVIAEGGAVTLVNHADILGTLSLTGALTRFENNGVWNGSDGESTFGGAAGSELINAAAATLRGGANIAIAETTVLSGLPLLTTHGLVTLVDGATGDVLRVADGDAAFQAGSALAVDLGGAATDLFVASGTVDLTGAALQFNLAGPLVYGARYTVLTAEGGLNGVFDTVTGLTEATAFIGFQDGYDANNAWLDAVLYRDFAEAGLTLNQIATGQGLDTIPDSGALFLAVANLPTDAAAQFAFDQLSGEIHAAAQLALIEDARFVRHAMADRLQAGYRLDGASDAVRRGGLAFWINGFGSWGSSDSDGNAASLDRTTGGFLIGADTSAGAWRFGLLAGYSHASFEAEDRASSGSSDNLHIGVYGGGEWGAFAFRSGAAYSWHDIDTERAVVFPGFAESLASEYDGNTFQIFGELAYGLDAGEATRIEPFANLAHVSLTRDGFAETGGLSALSGAEAEMDTTFSTLGLRLDHGFTLGSTKAAFRGMAGWRHAFGDINPASGHAFAGGDLFVVAGAPIAEDSAVIEAGFAFTLSPGASLDLSYTGLISDSAHDHGVRADLMVKF